MHISLSEQVRSCFHPRMFVCLVLTALILFCLPLLGNAQQPTATISVMNGQVLVSGTSAQIGMVLRTGDTLETGAGADVVLELSDGSRLELGENTNIDIAQLLQTSTGARVSRVKLLWGRVRSFLSPGHQKEGSSFDIETPNALVGVKFSQPQIETLYDADTKTTIIRAYTVEVSVLNLATGAEVPNMPKEHQAIVRDDFIMITKITEISHLIDQMRRMTQDEAADSQMDLLLETQQGAHASVGQVPGASEGTSREPAPGTPGRPGGGGQTSEFTFTITEE